MTNPVLTETGATERVPGLGEPAVANDQPVSVNTGTDLADRLPPDQTTRDLDYRDWTDSALFVAIHEHRGNLTAAAQSLGHRNKNKIQHYAKQHPEFAAALEKEITIALAARRDLVIKTGYDLAIDGKKKREYAANGQLIRETVEHDPKHVAWLMEREAPETYHLPTRTEITGAHGGPIHFKFAMDDGPRDRPDDTEIVDADDETFTELADWDDA